MGEYAEGILPAIPVKYSGLISERIRGLMRWAWIKMDEVAFSC